MAANATHPVSDEPPAIPLEHVLPCSRLDLANKSTSYGSSTHGGPAPCRVPEAGDGITRRAAIWPPHAISGGTWGGGTVVGMEARRWEGSGEEETPALTPAPTATSGYEHRCTCRSPNRSLLYLCSASPASSPLYLNEQSGGHTGGCRTSPAHPRLHSYRQQHAAKGVSGVRPSGVSIALDLFHAAVSGVSEVVVWRPYHIGVRHIETEVRV
jgi:hypothetical protein